MIITMSKKKNLLELAGGVVALVTLAALLTIAFTPKAHAISKCPVNPRPIGRGYKGS